MDLDDRIYDNGHGQIDIHVLDHKHNEGPVYGQISLPAVEQISS